MISLFYSYQLVKKNVGLEVGGQLCSDGREGEIGTWLAEEIETRANGWNPA